MSWTVTTRKFTLSFFFNVLNNNNIFKTKTWNFCEAKTINSEKATEWGKVFVNHLFDKELISKIY